MNNTVGTTATPNTQTVVKALQAAAIIIAVVIWVLTGQTPHCP